MRSNAAVLAMTICAFIINEGRGNTICQATDTWSCPSGTCECTVTCNNLNNERDDDVLDDDVLGSFGFDTVCECDDSCVCNGVVQSVQVSDPVPTCNALWTKVSRDAHAFPFLLLLYCGTPIEEPIKLYCSVYYHHARVL